MATVQVSEKLKPIVEWLDRCFKESTEQPGFFGRTVLRIEYQDSAAIVDKDHGKRDRLKIR